MITRIEVSIDELVVHGAAPSDRDRIAGALTGELTRLFAASASGRLSSSVDDARVDAGAFRVAPGSGAATLGSQVARAVYGALIR